MRDDPFISILYPTENSRSQTLETEEPEFFKDLHLSSVISKVAVDRFGPDLSRYYYTMLNDPDVIRYRQDILREIEQPEVQTAINEFAVSVFEVRHFLKQFHETYFGPENLIGHPLEEGKLLYAAVRYCNSIEKLMEFFRSAPPQSEGLMRFDRFMNELTGQDRYHAFAEDTRSLRSRMDRIEYCMQIRGNTVRVDKYNGQADFSVSITALFEKFRQGDVKDYRHRLVEAPYCDETEEGILKLLSGLYPNEFKSLDDFCRNWFDFDEPIMLDFSNEVQFYLRWLTFIEPLKESGLHFCYPRINTNKTAMSSVASFDLALAAQIFGKTVCNDFSMDAPERIIVITGPNQGGKTTFTRAFGQMHFLASLGLSVPGKRAELFLPEKILTHFEREEDLSSENGKLRDDLVRLKALMDQADDKSLVLVNEIFASTTMEDALLLGKKMMADLVDAGVCGIVVTFLDELASFSSETVSMMSLVTDDDSRTRTFKIMRKAPDGLTYALHIAARHGLTAEQLNRRLKS